MLLYAYNFSELMVMPVIDVNTLYAMASLAFLFIFCVSECLIIFTFSMMPDEAFFAGLLADVRAQPKTKEARTRLVFHERAPC